MCITQSSPKSQVTTLREACINATISTPCVRSEETQAGHSRKRRLSAPKSSYPMLEQVSTTYQGRSMRSDIRQRVSTHLNCSILCPSDQEFAVRAKAHAPHIRVPTGEAVQARLRFYHPVVCKHAYSLPTVTQSLARALCVCTNLWFDIMHTRCPLTTTVLSMNVLRFHHSILQKMRTRCTLMHSLQRGYTTFY